MALITMSKNKTSYFLVLLLVIISAFVTHRHIRSGFDPESGSDYDELLVYTLSHEFFYADEISYNLVGYPPLLLGLMRLHIEKLPLQKMIGHNPINRKPSISCVSGR